MRALVTGHEGLIGRHLVPKLIEAGYETHGTEDVETFVKSPAAATKWDLIVHLAANIINVHDRIKIGMRAFADMELDATMFKWVEQNPPAKALVVMSGRALDFPQDPHCTLKSTLEAFAHCLHEQGIPVVILRLFSGYGSDQSTEHPFPAILERAWRREDPLVVWGGSQVRDWIHVEDVCGALLHGIDHFPRGVPIPIGTGIGTDLFTLAKMLADGVGYTPKIVGDEAQEVSSLHRVADPALAAAYGWRSAMSLERGILRSIHEKGKQEAGGAFCAGAPGPAGQEGLHP